MTSRCQQKVNRKIMGRPNLNCHSSIAWMRLRGKCLRQGGCSRRPIPKSSTGAGGTQTSITICTDGDTPRACKCKLFGYTKPKFKPLRYTKPGTWCTTVLGRRSLPRCTLTPRKGFFGLHGWLMKDSRLQCVFPHGKSQYALFLEIDGVPGSGIVGLRWLQPLTGQQ